MNQEYSVKQIIVLTLLRVAVGWHFLYEGLFKYISGNWTSSGFLLNSTGPLKILFKSWARSPQLIKIVDMLNIWGLILIGVCLFLGLFEKPAKYFGLAMLILYYLAYPPFTALSASFYADGNYWIIDRNFVEMTAILVLIGFPSSHYLGVDRLIMRRKRDKYSIIKK